MVTSTAQTPEAYLAELPEERRRVISQLRELIRKNIPKGYVETVNWGMLTWEIPLKKYPNTYNGKPLGYVALAAQKNGYSLYMLGPYAEPEQVEEFRKAFEKAGKKLDMGKSCVRFRKLEDLELNAIATSIAGTPPDRYIELYEKARGGK
jgi:hypothetical protein